MRPHQPLQILPIALLPLLTCCTPLASEPISPQSPQKETTAIPKLSQIEKRRIGQKIWQNESGGKISGLTTWNHGEEFPSMGIGHFIWYPNGFEGRWTESFPPFILYAQRAGRKDIPAWVLKSPDCPWSSRADFQRDLNKAKLNSLRKFLANSIELQTEFIMQKSLAALPKMLAHAPAQDRAKIRANYAKVATTPQGTYALIDYVNFKGEGINTKERYAGHGWGLLQVLTEMKPTHHGPSAAKEFAAAAKRVLDRRIKNSPQARGEARWRAGWHNRCDTYAAPLQ